MNNQISFNSNGESNPFQFPSVQEGTGRFQEQEQLQFLKKVPINKTNISTHNFPVEKQSFQPTIQNEQLQHHPLNDIPILYCPEHNNKKAEFFCLQLGCSRKNPLLCQECSQTHMCKSQQPYDQFMKTFKEKFLNYDKNTWSQINSRKSNIIKEIQKILNNLIENVSQKITDLEPIILKRIFSDEGPAIDISAYLLQFILIRQFIYSILNCDINSLAQINDFQQITQNQAQTIKLLQNDFIDVQTIVQIFLPDIGQIQSRIEKFNLEINHQFNQFFINTHTMLSGNNNNQTFQNIQEKSTLFTNKQLEKSIDQLKEVKTLQGHRANQIVDFCEISDVIVASASNTGEIILWKLPSFTEIFRFQHGIECTSITTCLDELQQKFLISAYLRFKYFKIRGRTIDEYQIFLWNLEYRIQVAEVIGHNYPLRKVIALQDQRLAWCSQDPIVRVWNLKERKAQIDASHHTAWINDLCLIKENILASCSRDQTLATFDFLTGKIRYILKDETYITCLCSISKELFAYGNYNGAIKIYQTEYPVQVIQVQVNSSWLESNSIWQLQVLSEQFMACSSTNGKINFINISHQKKCTVKEIKIESERQSPPFIWLKRLNNLLTAQNQIIKSFQ